MNSFFFFFQGKTFPKLHRRIDNLAFNVSTVTGTDEESIGQTESDKIDDENTPPTEDYVFRIVFLSDRQLIDCSICCLV